MKGFREPHIVALFIVGGFLLIGLLSIIISGMQSTGESVSSYNSNTSEVQSVPSGTREYNPSEQASTSTQLTHSGNISEQNKLTKEEEKFFRRKMERMRKEYEFSQRNPEGYQRRLQQNAQRNEDYQHRVERENSLFNNY